MQVMQFIHSHQPNLVLYVRILPTFFLHAYFRPNLWRSNHLQWDFWLARYAHYACRGISGLQAMRVPPACMMRRGTHLFAPSAQIFTDCSIS